jgi:hypothetical protein
VGLLEAGRKTPEQVAAVIGDLLDGWQHERASAPKVSFHDEHALDANTQYEYCVSARNEFGEAFGPIVTVRTGKLLADPLAA